MFLKQIKIVGFKSFVEPTILEFHSDRAAIVGPNGCGKSNVIDAIRWVMGESSAKFLRGDLMADVIFNGSLKRKALSMASVEIIFDNTQKFLQGPFVAQAEVCLRREINRQGDSSYFINGQRVRRKDLSDLWLGTGAGSRGYAIIGQNMVNQLVEANPEALKAYLEEAAGVSKYKERRKESAERLLKVEENLSRIADILFELSGQIKRLEQEAGVALQYQKMKQSLRSLEEERRLFNLKTCFLKQDDLEKKTKTLVEEETNFNQGLQVLEQDLLQSSKHYQDILNETKREEHDLFRLQMDVELERKRQEKQIEEQRHYQHEEQNLKQEESELLRQSQEEDIQYQTSEQQLQELNIRIEHEQTQQKNQEAHYLQLKDKQRLLYHRRQDVRQKIHEGQTQIKVFTARMEQAKLSSQDLFEQKQRCQTALKQDALEDLRDKRAQITQKLSMMTIDISRLEQDIFVQQANYDIQEQNFQISVQALKRQQESFDQFRQDVLARQAHYHGLLSAMNSKIVADNPAWQSISTWLEAWSIPDKWQKLIDALWQKFLPDWIVEEWSGSYAPAYYGIMTQIDSKAPYGLTSLLDFMGLETYPSGFINWSKIYLLLDESSDVWSYQTQLAEDEIIVSAQGICLGKNWLYVMDLSQDASMGLASSLHLYQEAKMKFQQEEIDYQHALDKYQQEQQNQLNAQAHLASLKQHLLQAQTQVQTQLQIEKQYEHEQKIIEQNIERQKLELMHIEQQYLKTQVQCRQWQQDIEVLDLAETQLKNQEQEIQIDLDALQAQMSVLEAEQLSLTRALETLLLQKARLQTQYDYLKVHLPKQLERLHSIQERLSVIRLFLVKQEQEAIHPDWFMQQTQAIDAMQTQLKERALLSEQLQKEQQNKEHSLSELKQQQMLFLENKWKMQAELAQIQRQWQDLSPDLTGIQVRSLWQDLEFRSEDAYKKDIALLENKLQDLGDVNQLAVSMFEQERHRYQQLLLQEDDLKSAILELEQAIESLDAEMHIRLQTTLVAINQHLELIFPQLFGGGQAKFVASCDNLLEATVAVHVQAPGKKQHRIQLLSGGEKALTAVALLFAIFSLNPAPFCLLDEVDAALDDANVQRLANLIKTLSKTVQFVLITHNPLTMDAALELIGVTMQEPGVSRVVSVNMATALAMVNKE